MIYRPTTFVSTFPLFSDDFFLLLLLLLRFPQTSARITVEYIFRKKKIHSRQALRCFTRRTFLIYVLFSVFLPVTSSHTLPVVAFFFSSPRLFARIHRKLRTARQTFLRNFKSENPNNCLKRDTRISRVYTSTERTY